MDGCSTLFLDSFRDFLIALGIFFNVLVFKLDVYLVYFLCTSITLFMVLFFKLGGYIDNALYVINKILTYQKSVSRHFFLSIKNKVHHNIIKSHYYLSLI